MNFLLRHRPIVCHTYITTSYRKREETAYGFWKPYFVNKVLKTVITGDIIFYCDSVLFSRSIKKIVNNHFQKDSHYLFVISHYLNPALLKPLCFEKLNLREESIKTSNQIIATYFLFPCNAYYP